MDVPSCANSPERGKALICTKCRGTIHPERGIQQVLVLVRIVAGEKGPGRSVDEYVAARSRIFLINPGKPDIGKPVVRKALCFERFKI
ncbi:hypothetical protein D3C86_1602210 [compost metagenome]